MPVPKFAVISGASSGIGEASAIRLAKEGYRVCLVARSKNKLSGVLQKLSGKDHLLVSMDSRIDEQIDQMLKTIKKALGRVDVLVNSIGSADPHPIVDSPFQEWDKNIQTMLYGIIKICRGIVPLMPAGGRIINISSIHAFRVEKGMSSYATAKAGINAFTRSLALELAPQKILVNVICPGFVDTPMSVRPDGTNELETEWFKDNYIKYDHLPLKRAGQPDEIAGVVSFLASPDSSYMTGSVITVDGGLTITF